ncbi:MAG: hypothetical protein QOJ07_1330, partial [Thermoleophilaceae bacterium]|nr:hypothetical protein [Thermoleophilaceae bacterium]
MSRSRNQVVRRTLFGAAALLSLALPAQSFAAK